MDAEIHIFSKDDCTDKAIIDTLSAVARSMVMERNERIKLNLEKHGLRGHVVSDFKIVKQKGSEGPRFRARFDRGMAEVAVDFIVSPKMDIQIVKIVGPDNLLESGGNPETN